ncbi:MAG: ROK family protein [Planctomycetota bacterium]
MAERPAVGIDLGGTKIHAGVVAPDGRVLKDMRCPTEADKDAVTVMDNMRTAVHTVLERAGLEADDLAGVGLGSPAPLDIEEGVILSPGNLPSLHGYPVVEELSGMLGMRVVLNNDANCFGLAEARFGAGRGAAVCCGLTLGTGLGGCLVFDGEVFNGPRGAGGEIWCSPHMGDHIEEKVSGRGVARNYEKVTEERHTARELAQMARDGDETARRAWEEFGRDLAVPLAWLCNALDPDVCVMGGSLAKAWDLFEATMLEEAHKYINAVTREAVGIRRAELGEEAGMLGAAALVLGKTAPAAG